MTKTKKNDKHDLYVAIFCMFCGIVAIGMVVLNSAVPVPSGVFLILAFLNIALALVNLEKYYGSKIKTNSDV
jgi:hypothetical protein